MERVTGDAECFLRYAEDGTVLAGNLEGLVSRVIDRGTDSSRDERFRATFFTIYQLFSTSGRLFEILKRRFELATKLDPTDTRSQYSYVNIYYFW
jgi:RasGEF family protein